MNHAAVFRRSQIFTFRENRFNEERNQEGSKEGREKSSGQEEKVS
jgi:hypothetical protein